MKPKELVEKWVEAFNNGDAEAIAEFYAEDAINFQVPESLVEGKTAIKEMFEREFSEFDMTCIVENIFEDGEWAILEWKDPLGLQGCGFFHIQQDKIVLQRGYWDKLTFLRIYNLPVPYQ